MSRRFTSLIATALLLAACSSGQGTPQSGPSAGKDRKTAVLVEPVVFEPERIRFRAVGTSRARRSVVLHPPSAGEVTAVRFEPGQRVSKGDVLLELDARDEALAVKLARVRLKEAQRLYRRYRRSESSGAVTASDLDSARSAVDTARIELHRAEVALDNRVLEAPFEGRLGVTDLELGARVSEQTPVATLDDRSTLLISFELPETLTGRLAVGDPVSVSTWSAGDEPVAGRVAELDSRIDPQSRTFLARAEVDNSDDRLRPGMSFRVAVSLEGAEYPAVPEVALQWGGDGSFVWQVVDGKAVRVPVTIVQRRRGRILVKGGLAEGALVVREGVQRMRQGVAVSFRQDTNRAIIDERD
jgi:membrane fusion protein (multidrug efflux system)